jgi:ubiquitin carboxyl-terminal hydrolase 2/21
MPSNIKSRNIRLPSLKKLSARPIESQSLPSLEKLSLRTIESLIHPVKCPAFTYSVNLPNCAFKNLGNTCFMNSILQCLFSLKPLIGFLSTESSFPKTPLVQGSLTNAALVELASECQTAPVISPIRFKRQIGQRSRQFLGFEQHDAQEFLRILVDLLHTDLNMVKRPVKITYTEKEYESFCLQDRANISWNHFVLTQDSYIFQLFAGQLSSTVECKLCDFRSTVFELFWDLSLEIKDGSNSLTDCLDEFFKIEELQDMSCAKCKNGKYRKKMTIHRFPQTLVLHLKRFRQCKITRAISIPVEIEIGSEYYALRAISNHFGSLEGGHYTATVKNNQTWYNKNDAVSSATTSLDFSGAYIAFYERCN